MSGHTMEHKSIAVAEGTGHFEVIALRSFTPGEILFRIEGKRAAHPTRFTVQIDEGVHIDLDDGIDIDKIRYRYYWRFMNHSCVPNTYIRNLEVVALKLISSGEQITFNYNTTEFDMAAPFVCNCGQSPCLGLIRGFKHLPANEQERLQPILAPYLQRHFTNQKMPTATYAKTIRRFDAT